jgi:hypothetical protein
VIILVREYVRIGACSPGSQRDRFHSRRSPKILRTAPGDADEKTRYTAHKQERTSPAHLLQPVCKWQIQDVAWADKEECGNKSKAAEREADVEAPAPGGVLYEGSAENKSNNSEILRLLPQENVSSARRTCTIFTPTASPKRIKCNSDIEVLSFTADRPAGAASNASAPMLHERNTLSPPSSQAGNIKTW